MFEKQNIHFIGIAGIGMSAIAEVLHSKGFKVSGSDLNENNITRRLKKKRDQNFQYSFLKKYKGCRYYSSFLSNKREQH